MQRTTIRVKKEDQERIRDRAKEMNISQEKYISYLLDQEEQASAEPANPENDIYLKDLQKIKQLIYRIIRAVCPLTTEDPNDPDFDICLDEVYVDMNKHTEKYR